MSSQPRSALPSGKRSLARQAVGAALFFLLILTGGRVFRELFGKPSLQDWPLWAFVFLWAAFSTYWSAAARNSARARKSETRESRRVHEILVQSSLLLVLIPVPGLRQRILPPSSVLVGAGLLIQTAFALLGVWARRHLGNNWSGEITIKVDHRLIRTGPYGRVRHPIAMLGMFAGSALVSGQVHAAIGLILVSVAYARKIRLEEANLHEAFGPAYADYQRATWALMPGLF